MHVTASSNRTIEAFSIGVRAGLVAVGAGIAYVDIGGSATADTGNVEIGQSGTVGSLNISASATGTVEADAIGVTGGIVAGSATISIANFTPSVTATLGASSKVTVTDTVTVRASSIANLDVDRRSA